MPSNCYIGGSHIWRDFSWILASFGPFGLLWPFWPIGPFCGLFGSKGPQNRSTATPRRQALKFGAIEFTLRGRLCSNDAWLARPGRAFLGSVVRQNRRSAKFILRYDIIKEFFEPTIFSSVKINPFCGVGREGKAYPILGCFSFTPPLPDLSK